MILLTYVLLAICIVLSIQIGYLWNKYLEHKQHMIDMLDLVDELGTKHNSVARAVQDITNLIIEASKEDETNESMEAKRPTQVEEETATTPEVPVRS